MQQSTENSAPIPLAFGKANGKPTIALHLVAKAALDAWLREQPNDIAHWVQAHNYRADLGRVLVLPTLLSPPQSPNKNTFAIGGVLIGYGNEQQRQRTRFGALKSYADLPPAVYQLMTPLPVEEQNEFALGWLLSKYRFKPYKPKAHPSDTITIPSWQSAPEHNKTPELIAPKGINAHTLETIAQGEALTRDLINIPACDMAPADLSTIAHQLAERYQAKIEIIQGNALLERGFPLIHAVGRASPRAPCLIDMTWDNTGGNTKPLLVLVGKGVCFDTGGLNIKPSNSMQLMKKDMGGAANVLGLAFMIMAMNLPLRLRVLLPCADNAISGDAFRPKDILTSRKGLTVEVNNTDAEGRLVLADALAYACETDKPDFLVSMATLTGAARVAVGADLSPFFTNDDTIADILTSTGMRVRDPLWRLPFWPPYELMLDTETGGLNNAPAGGFAGAITAALFLKRFVDNNVPFVHFDLYAWQATPAPARSKGGTGQAMRALLSALPRILAIDHH